MIAVDNIIIGAGPGGYELAAALAQRGESVVIIERDRLGGTCLNHGCIPTKALCASAAAILNARSADSLGIIIPEISVDFPAVSARVDTVVDTLRDGVSSLLGRCTIIEGTAGFVDHRVVAVGDRLFTAPRIVIATGSAPARLPVDGAHLAITGDEAVRLDRLPDSVAIIGAGVIGMELASIFNALGAEVTVIEHCKEVLPTIEADIAKRLRTALTRRGITFHLGADIGRIEANDTARKVIFNTKKGENSILVQTVVMAVGRIPVVPEGFAGQLTPRGFISVDDAMRTSIDGVYAIGDVNGLLMLAHAAYAQGRVILHDNPALFDPAKIPSVVFTSPEVASVGQSAEQLEADGVRCHLVRRPFASNGKAVADGHPDGVLKLLVRDDDNTIVGCTILAHHAADLIAEATLLVTERVPFEQVGSHYIHAHPTLSEIFT